MRVARMRWSLGAGLVLALLAGAAGAAQAQQTAALSGRVTAAETGRPVEAAQVFIVGTTSGQLTTNDGRYVFRNLQPGTIQVRVLRVPFQSQVQTVTLVAGQDATLDFALQPAVAKLEQVVTTATGDQRAREVASAVSTIDAGEKVQQAPIANVGDLLRARAPGVQVITGATTGTGARVRIRGTSSLSLSNDPIYIIDGVRMESATNSTSIGVGGSTPSRVNDLNPEEIESIDVIKGPSAATLYGTDAANGVIVIKTKRGQAGKPQWSAYVEQGAVTQPVGRMPTAYSSWGTTLPAWTGVTPGTRITSCFLTRAEAGLCTRDSLTSLKITDTDDLTPFDRGHRQQYGLQVSGGSDQVRYFVSGEFEDEIGSFRMPKFGAERLEAALVPVNSDWRNPNQLSRATGRANLNVTLSPTAALAVSAGYISSEFRQPQADNNVTGWGYNVFAGPGFRNANGGYTAYGPDQIFQQRWAQNIDRFIGSVSPTWNPASWLALRGNFGVDFTNRIDTDRCLFGQCTGFGTRRQGFRRDNRTQFVQYTVDMGATGSFALTPDIGSKTTVGVQYFQNLFNRNGAFGQFLPPGASTISDGSVFFADESTSETRTLGMFVEQQVSYKERLFATAGLRADENSAFGKNLGAVYYPKFSLSWVASEEPFFPQWAWLSQLRLRTAIGASGVQPGTTDALPYLSATSVWNGGGPSSGLVYSTLGNPDLRPERSQEFEGGFDVALIDNRVNVELTYYNKKSKDALIQRVIAPSAGSGATSRFENLGSVKNHGWEWLVQGAALDLEPVRWDITLAGSHNTNELVSLGNVPPIVGASIRQVEGYPINGYWAQPFTYSDANRDGIITVDEVQTTADYEFMGYSQPRTELSLSNDFTFLDGMVRLSTLVDYKGGHKLYNVSERFRCGTAGNCQAINDPNASLFEQARAVALRESPTRTFAGYIEDADFIRFREVALTLNAPERWAARTQARSLSLTIAARNVGLWTDYTGMDPENTYGQTDIPSDLLTLPPTRMLTARLNVGF